MLNLYSSAILLPLFTIRDELTCSLFLSIQRHPLTSCTSEMAYSHGHTPAMPFGRSISITDGPVRHGPMFDIYHGKSAGVTPGTSGEVRLSSFNFEILSDKQPPRSRLIWLSSAPGSRQVMMESSKGSYQYVEFYFQYRLMCWRFLATGIGGWEFRVVTGGPCQYLSRLAGDAVGSTCSGNRNASVQPRSCYGSYQAKQRSW